MKTFFVLLVFNLCSISLLHANSDTLYPEVGKPCPEFLLKNVAYYNKKEVALADFKGKWLVLDFWNKYCSSCVESFPKTNRLQKEFKDRILFILIGIQDPENQIKGMYERFKKKMNLTIPCAFDSSLSNYWGIYSTPHIVIVDDKGIVQGVTISIDSIDMQKFLRGEHPVLQSTYYAQSSDSNIKEHRIAYDFHKPFMVNDNGAKSDTGYLFRSILTKWHQENQYASSPTNIYKDSTLFTTFPRGVFDALGVSLKDLYFYAYFGARNWNSNDTLLYGKYYDTVILKVKDSSPFRPTVFENRFCYSLMIPPAKASKENLQKAMQRDLKTYFGYDISIETRKCPYWRLVANEKAKKKLKTKGGYEHLNAFQKTEAIIPNVRYKFHNMSLREINNLIADVAKGIVLDETGIIDNIDITLDCINFDDLKASLQQNGLDIIPAEKEMKVLVIRDAKN